MSWVMMGACHADQQKVLCFAWKYTMLNPVKEQTGQAQPTCDGEVWIIMWCW
jgi:hypothetical protein